MSTSLHATKVFIATAALFLLLPVATFAATLSLTPSTGVYTAGSTFTVRAVVNTAGKSINAAEGTIKFNPQEVSVVSINRAGSIFNLWVTEPSFSNTAGTISFSGGLPTGYNGSSGTIFTITFRTTSASNARVSITDGSVLANDGMGTNVLSSMNGGTYTVQAASTSPEPEVVEYVAPANTPAAPSVSSATHGDTSRWYQAKTASLSWNVPAGVTGVRTLLDMSPSTIPTKVYEEPISFITLEDLPEGESYFHIQFRNADGWGRVTHYRLAIDSVAPSSFEITRPDGVDTANPIQTLLLKAVDETSGVRRYNVKINNDEPYEFLDEEGTGTLALPALLPGSYSVIIEAFDQAGNSRASSYSFVISAFDKPVFTEYPTEINEEVIPVVRGLTRAGATVDISITKIGAEPTRYTVVANEEGVFTLIPSGTFSTGVYELQARATDTFGAQSDLSDTIKIAVQQPGYIQVGSFLVNLLSVVVPLIAMTVLLVAASWFMLLYIRRFKRRLSVESGEAVGVVSKEFVRLREVLALKQLALTESRKTKKLTKIEEETFAALDTALKSAQQNIEKEVGDVEQLVHKKKS